MLWFSEKDFLDYRAYLMQEIDSATQSVIKNDQDVEYFLVGEFPDGRSRFVAVRPSLKNSHVNYPEFSHLASLVQDILPPDFNLVVIQRILNVGTVSRTKESN